MNAAETLRRAADLMRERAEAADAGPWQYDGQAVTSDWPGSAVARTGLYENGEHIAGMGPTVGLAMSYALEQHAEQHAVSACRSECMWEDWACGLVSTALAYLGEADPSP